MLVTPCSRDLRSRAPPTRRMNRAGKRSGPRAWIGPWPSVSPTQAEPLDQRPVARDVGALQVLQQPATLTHEDQQTATAVVVVLVLLEVLGEVLDALREHRDLDLGGARVALAGRVLGHDLLLRCGVEWHVAPSVLVARRSGAGSPGLYRSAAVRTASTSVTAPQRPHRITPGPTSALTTHVPGGAGGQGFGVRVGSGT